MNRKENIDLALRRAFTLALFVFALLIFKSTDSSVNGSFNKSDTMVIAFEKENSAILAESFSITGKVNTIVWSKIFSDNNSSTPNYKIVCAKNAINHLLQLSDHRFWEVKTDTYHRYPYRVRTSLDSGEVPLIS